jgi:hypothetical protein
LETRGTAFVLFIFCKSEKKENSKKICASYVFTTIRGRCTAGKISIVAKPYRLLVC